ncbi:mitochondrial sodium/calcium exchanger protein [Tetranychus urticae]|uniref:Sodium/calcium exchanger membrane region domain-containing protein n=1 Tax=Tetranychus urticae TaxID=32264 RepID=T1L264_TETUR|nr:mitochondrial sodium/calcium exchanger protein [Tetranychus urticae]
MWITTPSTFLTFHSPIIRNKTIEECLAVRDYLTHEARCDFVQNNHDCNTTLSLIDYNQFLFCGFEPEKIAYGVIICITWALILFLALAVTATDFLCPALFMISKILGLSQDVAGVTLVAFGNGSVDIFAAITGMRQGRPDLVIGDLLGGGMFVLLFVIGTLFSIKPFKLLAIPFIRDLIFYFIGVSWIFYLFIGIKCVRIYDAVGLLILYCVYVLTVIIIGKFDKSPSGLGFGHGHGGGDSDEEGITFEGITPDIDPNENMVVMKGFVMISDKPLPPPPPRNETYPTILKTSNLPAIIPIIKINNEDSKSELSVGETQMRKKSPSRVSIFEDNSVYDTISSVDNVYVNRGARRSRASSIFSISQTQMLQIRRASREFLERITPIDVMTWKRQNWGFRTLEIIKSPIRLFLLLTTPMADVEEKGEWNKLLSALHCVTGPLFVVFALGYGGTWLGKYVPLAFVVFVVAALLAVVLICKSHFETAPRYYKNYSAVLAFIVGVTWIYTIANECVSIIRTLGVAFGISEIAVGMTLLAVGNCFLDFVANIAIAKRGYPRMAVSACIGAPLLSLLIGVGIPTTLKIAPDPSSVIPLEPSVLIVVTYAALGATIWLTIIVTIILKFRATRSYGIFLVVLYVVLIIFVFLVEKKVVQIPLFE